MERCSVSSFSLFLLVVTLAFHSADARTLVFIFGDSTVDVGTNEFLEGRPGPVLGCPYGIDYPTNISTGRASNGYTLGDELARRMGYEESPPPYLALVSSSSSFLNGVNFASGGSGIFDSTGWHLTPRPLSLRDQIKQFSTVRDSITAELGAEEAARLLSQALFIVSDGGNDFAEYIRNLSQPIQWPSQFLRDLATTYRVHFQDLYNLGARKFGIVGIPPIGSTPVIKANLGFLGQFIVNLASQRFYDDTKKFMEDFKLEGMYYSIGNAIAFTNDAIRNPSIFGFTEVEKACWNVYNGTYISFTGEDVGVSCRNWNGPLCPNRDQYFFFDPFHPTQKAAELGSGALFHGGPNYAEPINFSDLVSIGIDQYPATQKATPDVGAFPLSGRKTKYG